MKYCFFHTNKRLWAIEAKAVSRVELLHDIIPLPKSHRGLLGLIPCQGRLVPLVNWSILAEEKPKQSLVLCDMRDGEQTSHCLALAVAKVEQFASLETPARSIPKHSERWQNAPAYVTGELWWQNKWIGMIDPQRWLDDVLKTI